MAASRLILDAGPVIAVGRGDDRVRALIARAAAEGADIVVPPSVVTQTLRGGARDAPIHRLLAGCLVPAVGLGLARRAGELLGQAGTSDVADAQIAAEAISGPPATVLTGDVDDMRVLVTGQPNVRIIPLP